MTPSTLGAECRTRRRGEERRDEDDVISAKMKKKIIGCSRLHCLLRNSLRSRLLAASAVQKDEEVEEEAPA